MKTCWVTAKQLIGNRWTGPTWTEFEILRHAARTTLMLRSRIAITGAARGHEVYQVPKDSAARADLWEACCAAYRLAAAPPVPLGG